MPLRKVGLGLSIVLIAGLAAAQPAAAPRRFEFSEDHMGTRFRIVLYSADEQIARGASQAAFRRVAELNGIMSDYVATSELMRLCQSAGGPPVVVSQDLYAVLSRADEISRLTDGAFDVTIGPVVRLWRRSRRTRELPLPERIAEAKALVDYRFIKLEPKARTVQLAKPGMLLDLGGIAKGYAAEQATKALKKHGITSSLVAAGGDIFVSDPPPGATGWRVGIAPLGVEERGAPTLILANRAVSTAGDAEQFVEIGGKRYSHIVDPRTGIGLTERIQVTVVAKDGMTADALDTGLSIVGAERGLPIIEGLAEVSARFVWKKDGKLEERRSKRFPEFVK